MLNTDEINPISSFNYNTNIIRSNVPKKNSFESKNPNNYSWKKLFIIMNKIKYTWHMKKFDNTFTLDMQSLNKCMYRNLKYCDKMQNLSLRNTILINDINSFFQTNLFDFLIQEQKVFDYYDDLFQKNQIYPKNDENIFFADFIIKYKEIFNSIKNNKKSKRQLKKLRWYIVCDEDNYYEDESNKNINNNDFLFEFAKEVDNNDSFDSIETKKVYDEYMKNTENKIVDSLDEINEVNIINDELINKLLKYENNPLFYIIKLIFLSITIFCKATVCHLLNSFTNIVENKYEEGKFLINEYLLNFNNFVDSCLIINDSCENINVVMNYLYESLFENYPKIPRFSIFRMCLRIWFTEINTQLIGKNSLLSTINKKIVSIFSVNIKEELFEKMEENLKNKKTPNAKSVNYNKSKSFGLSTSLMLFQSDNTNLNNNKDIFGTSYINTYDNSDKIYKILEKGLSIINDTYSNEYSVYKLHLSEIDTNTVYIQLETDFDYLINNYITKVFDVYLIEKKCEIKEIIDNILLYFDNYFFKTRIFSNLKKNIYEKVYSELKNNLLKFVKNKYLDEYCKNKKFNNFSLKSKSNSSVKTNISSINLNFNSNLKSSSIFDLNDDFNDINFFPNPEIRKDNIKQDIINYITKNLSVDINNEFIEKIIEDINDQIHIYDIFNTIEDWYTLHMNEIKGNDQRIKEELMKLNGHINKKINMPFDHFKRYLLSYSLQYDWAFIKKVKNIEKYLALKGNDDIIMEDNFGQNYPNDFGNLGNVYNGDDEDDDFNIFGNANNNNFNFGGFNLKSSFFK